MWSPPRRSANAFALSAVGPNPTRGTAAALLSLPEAGEVTVAFFDALGRQVEREQRAMSAGSRRLGLPTGDLAPGAYVVRVEGPGGTATRRITVMR
ncbi:MAG: T9SS type A sorting domain-containing protein [Bacteroidota bacterium]